MAKISKLEAAERLLTSGAAMVESGADILAIHVVTASALRILRDLIAHNGDDYVASLFRQGMYAAAEARLNGSQSPPPTPPEMDSVIDNIATEIKLGTVTGPDDLKDKLVLAEPHKMLSYIVDPYNFLKHADKDPLGTLEEDDVDPAGALAHAITAYSMLQPGKPLPDAVGSFLRAKGII